MLGCDRKRQTAHYTQGEKLCRFEPFGVQNAENRSHINSTRCLQHPENDSDAFFWFAFSSVSYRAVFAPESDLKEARFRGRLTRGFSCYRISFWGRFRQDFHWLVSHGEPQWKRLSPSTEIMLQIGRFNAKSPGVVTCNQAGESCAHIWNLPFNAPRQFPPSSLSWMIQSLFRLQHLWQGHCTSSQYYHR